MEYVPAKYDEFKHKFIEPSNSSNPTIQTCVEKSSTHC
jgi:hypothetical protein